MKKIVVTGCSMSAGAETIVETDRINEKLIKKMFLEDRLKSGKKSKVENIFDDAPKWFHEEEKKNSWPAYLDKKPGFEVKNLAVDGSSLGQNYLLFDDFIRSGTNTGEIVVHQIPNPNRFYLKVNQSIGRISLRPNSDLKIAGDQISGRGFVEFSNDRKNLENVLSRYRNKIASESYVKKFFDRLLQRLIVLGERHQYRQFFIFSQERDIPDDFPGEIIIRDLYKETKKYKLGFGNHPVDPQYAIDIAGIVESYID